MKFLHYLTKFNSYLPLVVLPVYTYDKFHNIFLAAICIMVWRLLTYFRYRFVDSCFQKGVNQIIFIAVLIVLAIVNRYLASTILVVVLLSSMLPYYINFNISGGKTNQQINSLLIIAGMIFSGVMLYKIDLLFYYLILFNFILIVSGEKVGNDPQNKIIRTINRSEAFNVFLHNFSYYIFTFAIPIVAYKYTASYYFTGLACSLSWILFLPRTYLTNFLGRIVNLRLIFAAGFLCTALLLFVMGKFPNPIIFFICLLIQGASGGISEGFWSLKEIKNDPESYWLIWKVGGVLGSLMGGLIAISQTEFCLFYIGAILTLLGGLFNIYLFITEGKRNENVRRNGY